VGTAPGPGAAGRSAGTPVSGRLDTWLFGLCASRFFINLIQMVYAASLPLLKPSWQMSATQAGSVATGFQLGYAVSLLGFSWLADRVGARRIVLASAGLSAAAALAFAGFARSYPAALVLYTLVALAQGGTYSGALMLISERYDSTRRGSAMGWLIASSSLSHAASLAIAGFTIPRGGYPLAFLVAAGGTVVGATAVWFSLRATPNTIHERHAGMRMQTEVLRNPEAMRLTVGYTFHSWELLGMWAWAPAFVAASLVVSGTGAIRSVEVGAYLASSLHVMGLLASSSMGYLSDRLGRRRLLFALAATSAACSMVFGWLIASPIAVIALVGAVYGFSGLGDSPVLSAALSEAVHPAYLGSALALRSFLGFGAGAIAPLVFGAILDATNPPGVTPVTWGWAFVALGIGGAIATICAYGLRESRRRPPAPRAA
jgi:MFS family permease